MQLTNMAEDSQPIEAKEFVPYTKQIIHRGLKILMLKEGESCQAPFPGDEKEGEISNTHTFICCFPNRLCSMQQKTMEYIHIYKSLHCNYITLVLFWMEPISIPIETEEPLSVLKLAKVSGFGLISCVLSTTHYNTLVDHSNHA